MIAVAPQKSDLLDVDALSVELPLPGAGPHSSVRVLDDVSLAIGGGEVLGLVGESGCGKTICGLAIAGLLPPGARRRGVVRFAGEELAAAGEPHDRRRPRLGRELGVVFQEPATALNPVLPVGFQLAEGLRLHRGLDREAARERARQLLRRVGLADDDALLRAYPHQLSGGMQQRVMIAIAIACEPKLLIADEPTTALDVTVQAQIIALLARLQRELGLAVLLISHDLSVVAQLSHRVCVLYAGQLVEQAATAELLDEPAHPYTAALLESIPVPDPAIRQSGTGLTGELPSPVSPPSGCRFRTRCPKATDLCATEEPVLRPVGDGHFVACHFPLEG